MKITSFTRPNVKALRVDLDSALAKVAKEYGIEISTGNISFSGSNASIKVKAAVIGDGGMVMTKEATDFSLYAKMNGLDAKLGDTFTYCGKTYTITGWKSRARKNPVLAENNGQTYRVPVQLVKSGL